MVTEKQVNKDTSEDPLPAKLLEIAEEAKQTDLDAIDLKCDECKRNAVIFLCINCSQCICEVCHKHHSNEKRDHDISIPLDKPPFCQEHNKALRYYCKTCNEYFCSRCKAKHDNGDNHNLGVIEEVTFKRWELLAKIAAQMVEINETLSRSESKLITPHREMEELLLGIKQSIDNYLEAQFENLQKRYEELKKELSYIVSQKEKALLGYLEEISLTQNEMIDSMKKLFNDVKTSSNQEAISKKELEIDVYVQKVNSQLKNLSSMPVGSDLIIFKPATESVEILGQLLTTEVNLSEIRNLSKCVIINETFEFYIVSKDKNNEYCTEGGSQVSVQLKSSTGEVTVGEVKDNNNGSYTVLMKAEKIGEAKVSAYINGIKIGGSPFNIKVLRGQAVPKKIVNCDGIPWGIAVAKNDMWAVTDNANHCVYIFSSQDQLVCTFGQKGNGKSEFNKPFGLAFDGNDYLYVADGGNHRVQKFDTTGKYMLEFGTKGNGNGELQDPYGITVHLDKAYVADFHNKRISVFQTDGQFCFCFGSEQLSSPRDVAIGTNDQLFVSDYYNHRIYIFTLKGDLVNEFGKEGSSEGDLRYPLRIATTWNEKIFISDKNYCVSIFCQGGQYVCCLGFSNRSSKDQLHYPHGVASKSNTIYVTDLINQRVLLFDLLNLTM